MRNNVTALIVAAHQLSPILERFRTQYILAPAAALPAHVTIYIPFLPESLIDHAALGRLADICGRRRRFEFTLDGIGRFPSAGVLYLTPRSCRPFAELHAAVQGEFPDLRPDFSPPVFHLTVAQGQPVQSLDSIEATFLRDYTARLPWHETAVDLRLYVKRDGVWSYRERFGLNA